MVKRPFNGFEYSPSFDDRGPDMQQRANDDRNSPTSKLHKIVERIFNTLYQILRYQAWKRGHANKMLTLFFNRIIVKKRIILLTVATHYEIPHCPASQKQTQIKTAVYKIFKMFLQDKEKEHY